jgi:hypothetical protein
MPEEQNESDESRESGINMMDGHHALQQRGSVTEDDEQRESEGEDDGEDENEGDDAG